MKDLEFFKIDNMSQSEYRGKSDYLSSSDLKALLDNPVSFLNKLEKPKTDNLILGSLIHCLILEPDNFEKDFIIKPKFNLRTKEGKEQALKWEQDVLIPALKNNQYLNVINDDLKEQAEIIVESFNKSDVKDLLKNGLSECSVFKSVEMDNKTYKLKCRPDFYDVNKNIIFDLKTTNLENGASPDNFLRNIANFKYYIQAALYLELTGAKEFIFIVIETKAPFTIGLYKLDNVSLDFGFSEIKRALNIFDNIEKYKNNIYLDAKNNFSRIQELTLPNYVYYKQGANLC